MSNLASAYGNFLGAALPFFQAMPAIVMPGVTLIKPGGRVAAYVRSTGAVDGEDHFASSGMLVSTIAAGLARCRASQNDIVYCLPGHTETFASTGAIFTPVAGAQIIGVGRPGATNNPTITLTHAGASLALSAANMTVAGMNIIGGVATATASVVVSAAGVTLANNYINLAAAALGANVGVLFSGAPNFVFNGNHYVADSTTHMLNVAGATSTNFEILSNFFRQAQGTSGGSFVGAADTSGISGICGYNAGKTATAGTPGTGFDLDAANIIANVLNIENYCTDNVATTGIIATGAIFS
jgi:hypothetical protein